MYATAKELSQMCPRKALHAQKVGKIHRSIQTETRKLLDWQDLLGFLLYMSTVFLNITYFVDATGHFDLTLYTINFKKCRAFVLLVHFV